MQCGVLTRVGFKSRGKGKGMSCRKVFPHFTYLQIYGILGEGATFLGASLPKLKRLIVLTSIANEVHDSIIKVHSARNKCGLESSGSAQLASVR